MNPSTVPVMFTFIQGLKTESKLVLNMWYSPGSTGVLFYTENSLVNLWFIYLFIFYSK